MLAEQITVGAQAVLEVRVSGSLPEWIPKEAGPPGYKSNKRTPDREVTLQLWESPDTGRVIIGNADGTKTVRATADPDELQQLTPPGEQRIVWVLATRGSEVTLQVHRFAPALFPDRVLGIGVDDETAERVRMELGNERASLATITQWLLDEFSMVGLGGGKKRRFIHTRRTGESDAAGDAVSDLAGQGFTLLGRTQAADLSFRDGKYVVKNLVPVHRRSKDRWPRYSEAELQFEDAGTQTAVDAEIRAALTTLNSTQKSYMDLWKSYSELERSALIDEAKRLGYVRYKQRTLGGNDQVWTFELSASEETAAFLRRLRTSGPNLELEAADQPPRELLAGGGARRTHRGTVLRQRSQPPAVDLRLETRPGAEFEEPPEHGFLFLSMSGSRTSQERRERARERIQTHNAEMRGLALLIEGIGDHGPARQLTAAHRKALRRTIRESFPEGTATPTQRRALEMALSTPDLLLVQGPPGTGKTQFITALLRCLDAAGESARGFNRTLVTSYQNDAVANVVSKSRNRGLPPALIDPNPDRSRKSVEALRHQIKLRAQQAHDALPEVQRSIDQARLHELAAAYAQVPLSARETADLLGRVEELADDALTYDLRSRLGEQRVKAEIRARPAIVLTESEHAGTLRVIRSLRAEPAAFDDDGPDLARRALPVLSRYDLLTEDDRGLLDQAAAWERQDQPHFLEQLSELQIRLLEKLGPDSTAMAPIHSHDTEVQALLDEVVEAVQQRLAGSDDGVGQVLAEYLRGLDGNVASIEQTLHGYSAVLASTVQHVDSRAMQRVMEAPLPVFGSIVVDEAARANPLDLMIPMSCARRRIVLVGDHKQLPHALESKLERELQRTGSFGDVTVLHQSLFERWFNRFKGEHPAIRAIKLDEQFRMHPELGRFVSNAFYDGPEEIRSHPSTSSLTHGLPTYAGKVAAWIDVPLSEGSEERLRPGFRRVPEAKRVAAELRTLSEQDPDRDLSFGVVTFYRGQKEAIWDALVDEDLAVPVEEGEYEPAQTMTHTRDGRPRLQVGTVDAFQGLEFDVVLLSVTRSSGHDPDPAPSAAIRRYGHLTREQRMCVAMSRQRRMLIAVGDAAMGDRALVPPHPDQANRSIVEGLAAFQELCRGPYGAGVRP